MLTATEITTIGVMGAGGQSLVPVDSGSGRLSRPVIRAKEGSPVATLERLYDYFIDQVEDPDTALLQNQNFDELMRQQPDVHAALLLREQTVAQFNWTMNRSTDPTANPEDAQRVADYVDICLRRLDMVSLYEEMQQAVGLGGSGHEFIWERGPDGVEIPTRFIHLQKTNFVFDRLGNMALLTRANPVWGAYISANPDNGPSQEPTQFADGRWAVFFPQGKFIYHKYTAIGGPWTRPAEMGFQYWGRGEDTRLYIIVMAAQFALRFWLKYLERFGVPPTDLYYPDNGRPTAEAQGIVNDILGGAVCAIPRLVGVGNEYSLYKVETRETPTMSNDIFASFLNEYIAPKVRMIILGSAEEQQKGEASGGFSDHVSRKKSGSGVIFNRDGLRISETLNRQLIPHIVLRKWPGLPEAYWPKHRLQAEEERDRLQEMEIAEKASTLVPIKEDEIYERSGFTKPGPDDKTVFNAQGQGGDDPFAAAMGGGMPPGGAGMPPGGVPGALAGPNGTGAGSTPIGQGSSGGKDVIGNGGGADAAD